MFLVDCGHLSDKVYDRILFYFFVITKKDKSHKGKGGRELQRVAVKYLGNKGNTVLIRLFGNMN